MPIDAIRRAEQSDVDSLIAVLRAAFAEQVPRLGLDEESAPWHPAFRRRPRMLEEMERFTFFLLIADGQPAGCIAIETNVDEARGGDGYIGRVGVHPDYRGRGYARLMMTFAEAALRDRGCRHVHLVVHAELTELIDLYRRLGYRVVGHRRFESGGLSFGLTDMRKALLQ